MLDHQLAAHEALTEEKQRDTVTIDTGGLVTIDELLEKICLRMGMPPG